MVLYVMPLNVKPGSSTLLTKPFAVSLVHLLTVSTVYHPKVCLNILSFPSQHTVYVCLAIDSYDLICSETSSYNADSVHILNNFLYALQYLSGCFKIASFEQVITWH
jgi:hypothetical protein